MSCDLTCIKTILGLTCFHGVKEKNPARKGFRRESTLREVLLGEFSGSCSSSFVVRKTEEGMDAIRKLQPRNFLLRDHMGMKLGNILVGRHKC